MEKAQTPLQDVQANIAKSCAIARREPEDVTLIAVSKMHPAEAIEPLLREGQRHFGENRVQEALAKMEGAPLGLQWELVGHLQSNKAKLAAGRFAS